MIKKNFLYIVLIIGFALIGNAKAQTASPNVENLKEVVIKSWKEGTETFNTQMFHIILSTQNKKYKQEIVGKSGKRYKLVAVHSPYHNLELEHWEIKLYEILSARDAKEEILSPNLITTSKDEVGKDYFPKEDFVGVLYPREKAFVFDENNEPMYGDSYSFYFIKTVRKIKAEDFYVIIKVGDFKFNKKHENKLDKFEVFIEFKNSLED